MQVSVAEAKNQLPKLLRAFERGEQVVITRHGKPVAQLAAPPPLKRKVRFGSLRGLIKCEPGWDAPMTEDDFLEGKF